MNAEMKRKLAEQTQNAITKCKSTFKTTRYRIEKCSIMQFAFSDYK